MLQGRVEVDTTSLDRRVPERFVLHEGWLTSGAKQPPHGVQYEDAPASGCGHRRSWKRRRIGSPRADATGRLSLAACVGLWSRDEQAPVPDGRDATRRDAEEERRSDVAAFATVA